jgi:hypothetical protein
MKKIFSMFMIILSGFVILLGGADAFYKAISNDIKESATLLVYCLINIFWMAVWIEIRGSLNG